MAQDSIFNLGGEDRGTVILPHAEPKSENLALSANATRNITQDTPFTPTILQQVHLWRYLEIFIMGVDFEAWKTKNKYMLTHYKVSLLVFILR
jgi:hypothetical protein